VSLNWRGHRIHGGDPDAVLLRLRLVVEILPSSDWIAPDFLLHRLMQYREPVHVAPKQSVRTRMRSAVVS